MSSSTDDGAPELLEVGRIGKAHGLRGEVVVELWTDRVERLDPGTVLTGTRGDLTVVSSRPHQRRWIVRFDGIPDRSAAEERRGEVLSAPPLDDPGTYWVHELIGSRVRTVDGTDCGVVESVVDNPASDLLELTGGTLVPLVFVVSGPDAGPDGGRLIVIDPPDGLLELGRATTG